MALRTRENKFSVGVRAFDKLQAALSGIVGKRHNASQTAGSFHSLLRAPAATIPPFTPAR